MTDAKGDGGGSQGDLAVDHAQHFFHLTESRRGLGIQAAQAAHGQHQHIELQGHLAAAIVDDAGLPVHGQTVGMAAALLPVGTDDVIDLFILVRHIQFLPGHHLMFIIEPGAFGKKTPAKAQVVAVVVFETNLFQSLLHGASFLWRYRRNFPPDGRSCGLAWERHMAAGDFRRREKS